MKSLKRLNDPDIAKLLFLKKVRDALYSSQLSSIFKIVYLTIRQRQTKRRVIKVV